MPKENPVSINVAEDGSILKFSPRLPILSSQKAFWNGIQIGHYRQPAAYETPQHSFPQHLISIHLNASIIKEQVLDGHLRSEHFADGDICITPANTPVAVRFNNPCEFALLHLEHTFITRTLSELSAVNSLEIVPQFKLRDPLIHQVGVALKAQLQIDGLGSRLYAESAATFLAVHLLQHYSAQKHTIQEYTGGLPKYKLRQTIDYINEHLAEDLSLAVIARQIDMSQYHFARLFKQSTGLAPHQYVIQCRIERAKQLLLQSKLSIAEVASLVGFTDQSHFTRYFKRLVGVKPTTVRKK